GLQYANIRLAAGDDDLFLLQPCEVIADLLFLGEIEEVLLEQLRLAELCLERGGQGAFAVDRALEGRDYRNAEIAEQAREGDEVLLHSAARGATAELGEEIVLHVDDCARAALGDKAFGHGGIRDQQSGIRDQAQG